jgi:predicted N-acyltransferase
VDALQALEAFAFGELGCMHIEIMDRNLTAEDYDLAGYRYRYFNGFEIDLTLDEDTLFKNMKPACRRCIRKADKSGVQLEVATDLEFADDYYAQALDVYAKQNLAPTYSKDRVRALIKFLLPTGQLLLVRARDAEGRCIATGIYPAMNDTTYFWSGASWREHQGLRPNEAIMWFAMQYWKERGIAKLDMGGSGDYKRKYGGEEIAVPWARKSRFPLIESSRNLAQSAAGMMQRLPARR